MLFNFAICLLARMIICFVFVLFFLFIILALWLACFLVLILFLIHFFIKISNLIYVKKKKKINKIISFTDIFGCNFVYFLKYKTIHNFNNYAILENKKLLNK